MTPDLAALISAIGKPPFPRTLLAVAGSAIVHDASTLMVLHPTRPPAVIVDRLKPAERSHLYGDYLSGVYLLSPFYRAALNLKAPRVARIAAIAPQGFTQSEYYRRYFALIGVADMIGMLIPCAGGASAFLSFSRGTGQGRFTAADAKGLENILGLLAASLTRHEELAGPIAGLEQRNGPKVSKPVPAATHGLTARESQVVNLILEGHSTKSIAHVLTIAIETVRVHRRHVYEKLGVSSQAELFRWFLASRD